MPGSSRTGVVAVAVLVRGQRKRKELALGRGGWLKENGGLDECLDERFVGIGGFGGWMDIHRSASLL